MAYVSGNGNLVSARERSWTLSAVPELFWDAVNFVVLFFRTLVNPNATSRGNNYQSDYRAYGSAPSNAGGPRRRIGGFGGGTGGPSCPPMAGGG